MSSNFGAAAVIRCGGRGASSGGGGGAAAAGGAPVEYDVGSASSSRPLMPFLNSTMPLPRDRATSGRRLPKSKTPRISSTIISVIPMPNTARLLQSGGQLRQVGGVGATIPAGHPVWLDYQKYSSRRWGSTSTSAAIRFFFEAPAAG